MQFLRLLDAAQREPGGPAGLLNRLPTTPILVFEQRQVRRDFAPKTGLLAAGPYEIREPPEEPPQAAHHSASLVSRRLTRSAERCHDWACPTRARIPDRVIA